MTTINKVVIINEVCGDLLKKHIQNIRGGGGKFLNFKLLEKRGHPRENSALVDFFP